MSAVLEEFPITGEDDESDLSITQHRELMSLLQQPTASLRERDLPIGGVLDPLYLNLSTPHLIHRMKKP